MFHFKQFTVCHDRCAMKVGTDGVLIGSWADCTDAYKILDVGTGSGLIALMLAQRSKAFVYAIDIDENACIQASFNIAESPFKDRMEVISSSYQDFHTDKNFNLIVTNPPYFEQALKSPDQSRTYARHNDTLSFEELISKSTSLLSEKGRFALILPFNAFTQFNSIACYYKLHLNRKTNVKPIPLSLPKRILLEYSFIEEELIENDLLIEVSRHVYSDEYIALTKDFYLKM